MSPVRSTVYIDGAASVVVTLVPDSKWPVVINVDHGGGLIQCTLAASEAVWRQLEAIHNPPDDAADPASDTFHDHAKGWE